MRLYSKYYTGKQVSWRDPQGETWVLYPDPITGEVFYIGETGDMADGYGDEFDIVVVEGENGEPDTFFAEFDLDEDVLQLHYGDWLNEDGLVPMGYVYGAVHIMDLFEMPDLEAKQLLADPNTGRHFVEWRSRPAPPAPVEANNPDE